LHERLRWRQGLHQLHCEVFAIAACMQHSCRTHVMPRWQNMCQGDRIWQMLLCVVQVVVLGVRPSVPPNMPEDFELLMKRYVPYMATQRGTRARRCQYNMQHMPYLVLPPHAACRLRTNAAMINHCMYWHSGLDALLSLLATPFNSGQHGLLCSWNSACSSDWLDAGQDWSVSKLNCT
jgi:hypothetical protein